MFGAKHFFIPETLNSISSPQLYDHHYDALEILSDFQSEIMDLFSSFKNSTSLKTTQTLICNIYNALAIYAQIEHEIFYPALRKALKQQGLEPDLKLTFDPLLELISQIDFKNPDMALHEQNVADLESYFSFYAQTQKNEVFAKAAKMQIDMEALGKRIDRRRMELALLKSMEWNCPYP